jgi:periplasmic protein CpxP/Spy
MKRLMMILFAAVLSLSMMSFAQSTGTDAQSAGQQGSGMHHGDGDHDRMMMDPQQMVNHLDQQLNLTADQKTKITTVLENSNKHAQELRANNSGDKTANREAMRQLHDNTHAQIKATLTPDQQTKFDAMMKDAMSGKHHHDSSSSDSTTGSTTDSPK